PTKSRHWAWSYALQGDRLAARRRFVDRGDDPQVAPSFLAGDARLAPVEDAVREIVHLRRELVDVGELHLFRSVGRDRASVEAVVREGGRELEGATLGRGPEAVGPGRVAARAVGHHAAGELQAEEHRLVHAAELGGVREPLLRRDRRGLLSRDVTGRLQRVDADVHERAAARALLVQPPLGGIADAEAGGAFDGLDRAEALLAGGARHLQVVGL